QYQRTAHRITSPWKWRHLKSVIVPSVQSPPSMLKLHDFCNRALLRKLASYPRQNNLAVALREVGRIERTLFIIEWILDTDMQRRAQIGLNKGEAHHALKNALRIGRQGEIRDRTTEGQHYRIAGLNLLTAVIIYWNTVHLGHAVTERRNEGLDVPPEFLPHISPLGWAHILLTGEYLWPKEPKA
ncbi:Tn3 family transposase, partial [Klebsiella pneumoniae]|uniref:Tn3 family transposase n=1 Tax=Klebsiella pneumoniae TaxID=573 RepID=UPI001CDAA5A2